MLDVCGMKRLRLLFFTLFTSSSLPSSGGAAALSPPRTPCLFTAAVSPCDWLYVDLLRTGVTSTCVSELTLSMLRSVPAGPGGVVGVGVLCVVCCVCLSPAATVRPHRQPLSRRRADEQRLFISLRLSELNSGRICDIPVSQWLHEASWTRS